MVRQANNKKCNACGADLVCPVCGVPSKSGTPFSRWLRDTEIKASCHDIDYVWHNYREGWFITLEEKTNGAQQSISQRDTHATVFQMLRASSPHRCLTLRGWRNIEYRGHYVISFEHTTPDNGTFTIDNRLATRSQLIELLEKGRVPWHADDG